MSVEVAKLPLKWRDAVSGVLVVDKPPGLTSFKTVDKVKKITGAAKVGHTGTLDPHATGVLGLCFNRATKIAQFLTRGDKTYRMVVKLGEETDTQDAEGEVLSSYSGEPPEEENVRAAARSFVGEALQKVPPYSAAKHKGRPLYYWARKGVAVNTPEKTVNIYRVDVLEVSWPEVSMEVMASAGTYMRTLASDLGAKLGTGGHLLGLKRLAAGNLTLEDALTLDEVGDLFRRGLLKERLISMFDAVSFLPALEIDPSVAFTVARGAKLKPRQVGPSLNRLGDYEGPVRVVSGNHLIALYRASRGAAGLWNLESLRVIKQVW